METFLLENDLKVFCVTASSFPDGIMVAHQKLHSMLSSSLPRTFFGISRPNEKGVIVYKAAAEQLTEGEAEKLNLETFIIKKGTYSIRTIRNYAENLPAVEKTFNELIHSPRIDPNGECVEWYLNEKDVRCMVRLQPVE